MQCAETSIPAAVVRDCRLHPEQVLMQALQLFLLPAINSGSGCKPSLQQIAQTQEDS